MSNQHENPPENPGIPDPGETAPETLTPEQQVLELNQKVADLGLALADAQADADKYRNEVQYKEAELQTERRRFAEQRADAAKYRDEALLRELLPAMEGLELALQSEVTDQWGEGVKLAVREIKRRLEFRGVSLINADAGQPFDPNEHEPLGAEPSAEHPPGSITRTLRPGYRLHERVVRAAQVMVAQ